MNRGKRLLVFALVCYILMDLGMRLYVFGPSFFHRWRYGFTEGESVTITQRVANAMGRPGWILKGQMKSRSASFQLPPWRRLLVLWFRSLEWRLDSLDPGIRDPALLDLDRAQPKVKIRVARFIGERLSTRNPQQFFRDLGVLERLGPLSGAALPPILAHFSEMDPYSQFSLIGWFGSLNNAGRPALPLLREELNGLDKKEIHFFRLSCGTPPLPEYLSPELSRAAGVIQAIVAIDPGSTDFVLSKLRNLLETRRKDLEYFCHRETGKITDPNHRL